jgi:uncharacterized repeat protein (TIGR02543 family)/prepilin-type N-terminal cleavage/methylation domain-containing protein
MKKNGFTLIELLATVAVLLILITLVTPVVINQLKSASNVAENKQINTLIDIAKIYTNQNTDKLPEKNSISSVSIDELKQSGLINKNQILNPKTNEELTGCIVIEDENNKYKYEYKNNCNITIAFDANGGTVSQTTKDVTIGKKYGDLPTPTKTGYTFKGWTGKNIFDIEHFVDTYKKHMNRRPKKTEFDGYEVYKIYGDTSVTGRNLHYMEGKFKENTQYTFSMDIYDVLTSNIEGNAIIVVYSDDTSERIDSRNRVENEWKTINFTSAENKTISYIRITYGSSLAYSYIKNFQIEEGTEKTEYEPYKKYTENSSVENVDTKKLNAIWGQAPELVLSKETYKDIDFSDWTLSSNSSVNNGELIIGSDGQTASVTSGYIDVNYDFWYMTFDAYTTVSSSYYNPFNSVHWGTNYYNLYKQSTTNLAGGTSSGYAKTIVLNEWEENLYWYTVDDWKAQNRYGTNVKYMRITLPGNRTQSPIIIRNLKIYGQMTNSFYLINTEITNGEAIVIRKYDKGVKTADYFRTSGIDFEGTQITVDSNGIYTVYVEDAAGNYSIQTIEITNII